ncbi:MAG: hypothetical protein WC429_14475 [Verrucomicrobiia bacterium]|jgi:hypothetical protein
MTESPLATSSRLKRGHHQTFQLNSNRCLKPLHSRLIKRFVLWPRSALHYLKSNQAGNINTILITHSDMDYYKGFKHHHDE